MFHSCEEKILKKNPILPIGKFPSLELYYCQVVAYGRLKTKKKDQTFLSKSGSGHLRELAAHMRF